MRDWFMRVVLRKRPQMPTCGKYIRFRQGPGPGRGGQTFGEFIFASSDVEAMLQKHLSENPHLLRDQDGAIFSWVRARDDGIAAPSSIPDSWWRFQYVADELLRQRLGEVHCLRCNVPVLHDQFPSQEDQYRGDWVFSSFTCPNGHLLLDVETVHLHVRR